MQLVTLTIVSVGSNSKSFISLLHQGHINSWIQIPYEYVFGLTEEPGHYVGVTGEFDVDAQFLKSKGF